MITGEKTETPEKTQIRSVAKALTIIDHLASSQAGMPLAKIARKMDVSKSTIHGLLATLKDFGYVEQCQFTGNYKLGIRLFEIGSIVASFWDVRTIAGPYIQQLMESIGETVHLVILDKGEVLYIDKRESHQSFRIVSQVGMRLPAHCTGVGKVLLAHLSTNELNKIIATKGLQRFTKNTITESKKLEKELHLILEQGYAVDNEEIMDSLRCVAASVFDHTGKACAAISMSGPVARLSGERFELVVNTVTQTARDISVALGYRNAAGSGGDQVGT